MTDLSDELLFASLARAAERCLGEFKAQNLANTAWAFATADRLETPLLVSIVPKAARALTEFHQVELRMTLWVLWRHESLITALTFFKHAKCVISSSITSSTVDCFGAVLIECEQTASTDHELALLQGLKVH